MLDQGQSLWLGDSSNTLANCFSFERKPDELSAHENSGQAIWRATLKPQASFAVNYVIACGEKAEVVHELAAKWAA